MTDSSHGDRRRIIHHVRVVIGMRFRDLPVLSSENTPNQAYVFPKRYTFSCFDGQERDGEFLAARLISVTKVYLWLGVLSQEYSYT